MEVEVHARRRLVRAQRRLSTVAPKQAAQSVKGRKVVAARAVRTESEELNGKALMRSMANVEPASAEAMQALADALHNQAVRQFVVGKDARHRSTDALWYKLYLRMDSDGTGLISYTELK